MKRALVCGIPAVGKTSLGEYLSMSHGFYHQDMEVAGFEPVRRFRNDTHAFLGNLASHEDVVITWGFGPFRNREDVEIIREAGYKLFWFDGNRVASFRHFMKREGNDENRELSYHDQMQMIIVTGIVERLQPVIINPFDEIGNFRSSETVAQEVLGYL